MRDRQTNDDAFGRDRDAVLDQDVQNRLPTQLGQFGPLRGPLDDDRRVDRRDRVGDFDELVTAVQVQKLPAQSTKS